MPSDAMVARRYARALYELAGEAGLTDAVQTALGRVADVLDSGDPPVLELLGSPAFSIAERRSMLERVLEPLGVPGLVRSFLLLALDRHRIRLLPQVRVAWCALGDGDACRVRATVATARPLAPGTVEDVRGALAGLTGGPVELTARTDPSLLGGAVVQMGDTVWDASLRSRLEAMERSLLSTHPAGTRAP